jgi:hypothetical protein
MVCLKAPLIPAKERKNESSQCDDRWDARDSEKPRDADAEPCAPMYDGPLMKGELRVVVPSDVHHETGNKRSYHTDDAEGNPTEMESTRARHLTMVRRKFVRHRELFFA